MKKYTQLSLREREQIYVLWQNGMSAKAIANGLNRFESTVLRELKRNSSAELGYLPDKAHQMAAKRKHRMEKKLIKNPSIKEYVISKLKQKWSPETIAGRLRIIFGRKYSIATETIYLFIYSPEGKALGLYQYLVKGRPARGCLFGRTKHKITIPDRISIHEREPGIETRKEMGHFEGDLTFLKGNQSANISALIERKSRYVLLVKNDSKNSKIVMKGIFNALATLPQDARKSVTFDNGKEFAKHSLLKNYLGMLTYFCDPHSPWQKGQVEYCNALLHRFIPKNTSWKIVTDKLLERVQTAINNLPRKCLGFKTPSEVFLENLGVIALHP